MVYLRHMIQKDKNNQQFLYGFAAAATIGVFVFMLVFFNIEFKNGDNNQPESEIAAAEVSIPQRNQQLAKGQNKLPASSGRPVKLLFFGDMMLDRHVGERIAKSGLDSLFVGLTKATSSIDLFDYDFVSANLEGTVTNDGAHHPPAVAYDFAFNPELIRQLKNYNFSFLSSANNHFYDQGQQGVTETRSNLDALGYGHVGCPDRAVGDCSAKVVAVKGMKIGMAGFSMVAGMIDMGAAVSAIAELASTTDMVIVNIHWGVEYEHQFNQTQKQTARALIDAGADLIIGHHPHVVQGVEVYKGKAIFYSLGNFIFDQYFSPDTQSELGVAVTIEGKKLSFELLPMESRLSAPFLLTGEDKKKFLEDLAGWSDVESDEAEELRTGNLNF